MHQYREWEPARAGAVWPWITLTLCTLSVVMMVFFSLLSPAGQEVWMRFWGFEPAVVMNRLALLPAAWVSRDMMGLLTALMVHAGWLHLLGNLAYLWVFGIPVERIVGHWRFVLVFVLLGGFANLCAAWQLADMTTPVIGASGGVSAVIGVYLGLFPARRMGLWLPLGLYFQFARIPGILVIGSWFILQLLYTVFGPITGAVAWWTHVVGFLAGLFMALLFRLFSGKVNRRIREFQS